MPLKYAPARTSRHYADGEWLLLRHSQTHHLAFAMTRVALRKTKWQIRVKTGDMDMTHSVDGILVLSSVRQRQEVLVKLSRFQAISAPYNEVLFWPLAVRHGNRSNY